MHTRTAGFQWGIPGEASWRLDTQYGPHIVAGASIFFRNIFVVSLKLSFLKLETTHTHTHTHTHSCK
jgi:hypothetical protein